MKITKVTISNFRQYKEKSEITFSTDKEKNVTILIGENGEGKTNLFRAINWCLFGETDDSLHILNKASLKIASEKNEQTEAEVTVSFIHGGLKYTITRTLTARKVKQVKREEGVDYEYSREEFAYLTYWETNGKSVTKDKEDIPTEMSAILSKKLRRYFLFDAEKMDELTKEGQEEAVQNGVKDMLRFEVIERSLNHLIKTKDSYNKDLRKLADDDLDAAIKSKEALNKSIEDSKAGVTEIDKELEAVKDLITDVTLQISQSGDKKAVELSDQITRLQQRVDEHEQYRREAFESIHDKISTCYQIICLKLISSTKEKIHVLREIDKIIPSIPRDDILSIINKGQCICGTEFKDATGKPDKKSKEYKILMSEVEGKLSKDVQIEIEKISDGISSLHQLRNLRLEQIRDKLQDYTTYDTKIEGLQKDIVGLKNELVQSKEIIEKARKLQERKEKLEAEREKLLIKKGEIKFKISTDQKRLDETEKEIKDLLESQAVGQQIKKQYLLADSAYSVLTKVYKEYCDEMKDRIQIRTQEIFANLVWKDSQFKEIIISADYKLDLLDRYNTIARKELSAGERQLLSLSFILALSIETKMEAPFIVDTPLGRISGKNRRNIAKHLPVYADQLFLIVTPDEINNPEMDELKTHVGSWWRIEFDSGQSKLVFTRQ